MRVTNFVSVCDIGLAETLLELAESDMSPSEFEDRMRTVLDELNKATYYFNILENPSTPTPMFLDN
jgi:hypothetical protein